MKKIYTNSKFARLILCLSDCDTITLGPFIFARDEEISQEAKNHETTHVLQFVEWFIVSFLIVALAIWAQNAPSWLLVVPLTLYYLLYCLEWALRFIWSLPRAKWKLKQANKIAYNSLSFEVEAYGYEHDCHYNENRNYFANLIHVRERWRY